MLVDVFCPECDSVEEELAKRRDNVPSCPQCGGKRVALYTGGPTLVGVSPSAPIRVHGRELTSNTELKLWQAANPDTALVEKGSADAKKMEESVIADQEKIAQRHGLSYGSMLEKTKASQKRRLAAGAAGK